MTTNKNIRYRRTAPSEHKDKSKASIASGTPYSDELKSEMRYN